jgi:hypothetical protein
VPKEAVKFAKMTSLRILVPVKRVIDYAVCDFLERDLGVCVCEEVGEED